MRHRDCNLKKQGVACPFEILAELQDEAKRRKRPKDDPDERGSRTPPRTQEAVSRHAVRVAKEVMAEALLQAMQPDRAGDAAPRAAPVAPPFRPTVSPGRREFRVPAWVWFGAGAAGIAGGLHFNWTQRINALTSQGLKRKLRGAPWTPPGGPS